MYTLPELIKEIRNESGLTQAQFADGMGVSTVLIAMIESGQKDVSKKLILRLAEEMNVHPSSLTPFIFINENPNSNNLSIVERPLVRWGEKIQKLLIKKRAKRLKKYARQKIS